jgi:hypothetical protein
MGRIYVGAANVLVLDAALAKINYDDLGDEIEHNNSANILVAASPWMARSWPLKENVHFGICFCDLSESRAFKVFRAVGSLTLARLCSSQKHPSKLLANITDRAALASAIYVKFADCKMLYKHSHLGTAANLASMPNQKENNEYIS